MTVMDDACVPQDAQCARSLMDVPWNIFPIELMNETHVPREEPVKV
jgi:hypothetical protein